jgi:uncharacterized protein
MIEAPADASALRALVYGGAVLGGGGGGSLAAGLAAVREALAAGVPRIVSIDRIPDDAILATLSIVGSVGKSGNVKLGRPDFRRAIDLFEPFAGRSISGFIASEVGPLAVTYGLLDSARTNIPVVDAPGDGRAHPLFAMGSLGLHRRPCHATTTVAVGGRKGSANYVELAIRANVSKAARIVRERAAQGGIALAVVRNPAPVAFVRKHAAVGALAFARRVGRVLLAKQSEGIAAVMPALANLMGGKIVADGVVESAALSERRGFTLGRIRIRRVDGARLSIAVCNEYIAASNPGGRIASFPDLIAIFDHESGLPLASTEVRTNGRVVVFTVPRNRLPLGVATGDSRLLAQVEELIRSSRNPLHTNERSLRSAKRAFERGERFRGSQKNVRRERQKSLVV